MKVESGSAKIATAKVADKKKYEGKWVLITNTDLPTSYEDSGVVPCLFSGDEMWLFQAILESQLFNISPLFSRRLRHPSAGAAAFTEDEN